MKKTTLILSSVLVMSLGAASLASAAGMQHGKGKGMGPRGMNVEQMFQELDTNKDGELTKDEMQAAGAARFTAADTDGDGFLSAEELKAAAEKRAAERQAMRGDRSAKMLEKLDTDKDGKLSLEEMQARGSKGGGKDRGARGMKMFDRADANNDGVLTMEELQEAKAKMGNRMGRHGKGKGQQDTQTN